MESLSDIERDLRDRADCAERHGDRETHNDGVAMFLRSIADRIKASRNTPGNAAAMRKALIAVKKGIDGMGTSSLDCDPMILMSALTQVCARLSARIDAALSAPARNCDRFSGNYKMLHTAWFDWTGSPSGHLPDGTVKMTFAAWLLAPAERKGGGDA